MVYDKLCCIAQNIGLTIRKYMNKTMHQSNACFSRFSAMFISVITGVCRGEDIPQGNGLSEQPDWILEGFSNITGIAAGDLNADGAADVMLLGADQHGYGILIFHQNAGGMFNNLPDRRFELDRRAQYPLIGDFDGDGKQDFAIALKKELRVFLGADNYAKPLRVMNTNQSHKHGPLLYGAWQPNAEVFQVGPVLYRYGGKSRLSPGYFKGPEINDNQYAGWGDFDHDGLLDVVFSVMGGGLRIYYGPFAGLTIKPGDLSQYVELDIGVASGYPLICDLNNDCRLDITVNGILTEKDPKKRRRGLFMIFQNSPQGFDNINSPSHVIWTDASAWAAADVDQDGLADLVLVVNSQLRVFLQKAETFWADDDKKPDMQRKLPGPATIMATADANQDGRPDLLVAGLDFAVLYKSR